MCLATLRIAWDMQGFVVEIRTQWRVPGTKILNGHVTSFGDLAPLFSFLSKHFRSRIARDCYFLKHLAMGWGSR